MNLSNKSYGNAYTFQLFVLISLVWGKLKKEKTSSAIYFMLAHAEKFIGCEHDRYFRAIVFFVMK
jgi:hypothetical protein